MLEVTPFELFMRDDFWLSIYSGIPFLIFELLFIVIALPIYLRWRENRQWKPMRKFIANNIATQFGHQEEYAKSICKLTNAIESKYCSNTNEIFDSKTDKLNIEIYTKINQTNVARVIRDTDLFSSCITAELAAPLVELIHALNKFSDACYFVNSGFNDILDNATLQGTPKAIYVDVEKDLSKVPDEKAKNYIIFELGAVKNGLDKLCNSTAKLVVAYEEIERSYIPFAKLMNGDKVSLLQPLKKVQEGKNLSLLGELKNRSVSVLKLKTIVEKRYEQLVEEYAEKHRQQMSMQKKN